MGRSLSFVFTGNQQERVFEQKPIYRNRQWPRSWFFALNDAAVKWLGRLYCRTDPHNRTSPLRPARDISPVQIDKSDTTF